MKNVATIILLVAYGAAGFGADAHLLAIGRESPDPTIRVLMGIGWPALLVGFALNKLDDRPAKALP